MAREVMFEKSFSLALALSLSLSANFQRSAYAIPGTGISITSGPTRSTSAIPAPTAGTLLTVLTGNEPGEQFGASLSGGRDLNADGVDDLLVGAHLRDTYATDSGGASCFAGPIAVNLPGPQANTVAVLDYMGQSLSLLPDLNGDGRADYAIGIPYDNRELPPIAHDIGSITLFSGADGQHLIIPTTSSERFIKFGESVGSNFGYSVAFVGDLNSDGHPDIAVGAPYEQNRGKIYVYSLSNGDLIFSALGNSPGERFGWSLAAAGDLNNDGYDDLIVGSDFADGAGTDSGKAQVISGQNGAVLYTFQGVGSNDNFGRYLASGVDINQDGYNDILIGAPSVGPYDSSGAAYLYSGLDGSLLHSFSGSIGERLGTVALLEDFNGDSIPDIAIGSPNASVGGTVTIYSGADYLPIVTRSPGIPGSFFGRSLADIGDFNGDGFSDIAVGAPSANGIGKVFIYSGGL